MARKCLVRAPSKKAIKKVKRRGKKIWGGLFK